MGQPSGLAALSGYCIRRARAIQGVRRICATRTLRRDKG